MTTVETVTYETLAEMFETCKRDKDEYFVCLKDDAPEWAQDFVREAHGTDFFPDDYRYQWISEALEVLGDSENGLDDLAHEFADAVDVYTSDLLLWLSSNLRRTMYCDEAQEEGLIPEDADITKRIMVGQYLERQEVFWSVVRAAKNYLDE